MVFERSYSSYNVLAMESIENFQSYCFALPIFEVVIFFASMDLHLFDSHRNCRLVLLQSLSLKILGSGSENAYCGNCSLIIG
jgi:hypothetical protein